MNERIGRLPPPRVLVAHHEIGANTATSRALRDLVNELRLLDIQVIESTSLDDAQAIVVADPSLECVLVDWELSADHSTHSAPRSLLEHIRSRHAKLPVFLVAEHSDISSVPLTAMQQVDDFIWVLEDTADFIAGRIAAAIGRYREQLLPPFFAALVDFARTYEYSWHTPGHAGGTAFLRSPVGKAFFDFFGESLLRSDLSVSVGELGSLLDHSGPIGEGERYAARVMGAHRSYSVTNGTSTSNRIVFAASVARDDVVLCDRNCHKSIEHSITMTGAIPTYLLPSRNRYGIIGPIRPELLTSDAVRSAVTKNPLLGAGTSQEPVHAVITNSTYDGLCYNVTRVLRLLSQSVDRVHFDEAWYGYARFNSIYRDRYAMHGDPDKYVGPTVFATISTHKLLAALSQASLINIRDGRNPIEHARFNEAFMMHSSTSPQYAIIASNDVATGMMDGPMGQALTTECIEEAVRFRQTMARVRHEFSSHDEWFFGVWQPDEVLDPSAGKRVVLALAPEVLLITNPSCWVLHPDDTWHGFGNLEEDYCMLDPIKVSVVTPGLAPDGTLERWGIPAMLVTAFLDCQGVVVEKTTDFTMLFLFSMGVTKGKWGTLLTALLDFKKAYDANASLTETLPSLVAAHPDHYDGMGLRDLATQMFEQMRAERNTQFLAEAFSLLPYAVMTPSEAYEHLVRNNVAEVALDNMAERTVAVGVVPYPPGIPVLMPGENAGADDGAILNYLRALQAFDAHFPGFGHEIHGAESRDDKYFVHCVK